MLWDFGLNKLNRKENTKKKILLALKQQLMDQGFRGIGINVVARRAGVSKELIYRYFGSMDNLIRDLMVQEDYWAMQSSKDVESYNNSKFVNKENEIINMLFQQIEDLRNNKELQEIRRWELIDLNDLTFELSQRRETSSKDFLKRNGIVEGDIEAGKLAILLSGILYLVLRSKISNEWFGINLEDNNGWDILKLSLKNLVKASFSEKNNLNGEDVQKEKK